MFLSQHPFAVAYQGITGHKQTHRKAYKGEYIPYGEGIGMPYPVSQAQQAISLGERDMEAIHLIGVVSRHHALVDQ
jgi:hypothetical protein